MTVWSFCRLSLHGVILPLPLALYFVRKMQQYIPEEMYYFQPMANAITMVNVKQEVLRTLQGYFIWFVTDNQFHEARTASDAVMFFCSDMLAREETVLTQALAGHYQAFQQEHGEEYTSRMYYELVRTFNPDVHRHFQMQVDRASPVPFLHREPYIARVDSKRKRTDEDDDQAAFRPRQHVIPLN